MYFGFLLPSFALTRLREKSIHAFTQERMVRLDGTDGYCCQHHWLLVLSLRL